MLVKEACECIYLAFTSELKAHLSYIQTPYRAQIFLLC